MYMTRENIVKVHSHRSQRAKPRDSGDRKIVFKGVLDNPHRVPWPFVPPNAQNSILAHLLDLLDGVAEYHQKCCANTRKRKRRLEVINGPQYRDAEGRTTGGNMDVVDRGLPSEIQTDPLAPPDTADGSEPPLILKSLICGINAVTKQLEAQIEDSRPKIVLKSTDDIERAEERKPIIRYLFVCRADVDPPVLIDHLPHLVATYNALRQSDLPPTILVPLPKGAEAPLAQAMGVRRLAALAIDSSLVAASERLATASTIPLVTAPWFSSQPGRSYVQTHIKQLRTTAPRDMKVAKEARMRGKIMAKTRRTPHGKPGAVSTK